MTERIPIIEQFFKETELRIPIYQRNYDWKKENCDKLFEDILELIGRPGKKHFTGSIIFQNDPYSEEKIIIDGQQRITTIALLLAAMRDEIADGKLTTDNPKLLVQITDKLVNRYDGEVFLHPVQKDALAYEKLILKKEITEGSNICSNYHHFRELIEGEEPELTADSLFDAVKRLNVMLVYISVEDGDDPQAIFESINSTGLNLNDGDRIRNYILMNNTPKEQDRIYKDYWIPVEIKLGDDLTKFFRDYLIIRTQEIPRKDAVYASFRRYANGQKDKGAYEDLLMDLLHTSEIYRKMLHADLKDISERASDCMFHINYIGLTISYPFIEPVLDLHYSEPDRMTSKDVTAVLEITENFLVRRLICGIPSNALSKLIPPMFRQTMSLEGPESFVEKLKYTLLRREGTSRYPLDDEVTADLARTNLYDRHKMCALVLSLLEYANMESVDTLRLVDEGKYSIEHIMPQKLSEEWMRSLGANYEDIAEKWTHRLGNLTLTAYNSDYSNSSYGTKRELPEKGFLYSPLWLNSFMKSHETWGEKEIAERNTLLVERFVEVVPELTTSYSPINPREYRIPLTSNPNEFYSLKIRGYVLDGGVVRCRNAVDTYLKLMAYLCDKDPDRMVEISKMKGPKQPGIYIDTVGGKDSLAPIGHGLYAWYEMDNYGKFNLLRKVVTMMGMDPNSIQLIVDPDSLSL